MQLKKSLAFEKIRFRSVDVSAMGWRVQGAVLKLHHALHQTVLRQEHMLNLGFLQEVTPPGFASGSHQTVCQKKFVTQGNTKSLQVINMKDPGDVGQRAREGYDKLIEDMPEIAIEKLGILDTPTKRFAALTNLCRKHSGELVAVDHTRDYWRLIEVDKQYFWWHWGEQFFAMEGGHSVSAALPGRDRTAQREQEHKQWGPFLEGQQNVRTEMSNDINEAVTLTHCDRHAFQPDWDKLTFRHVCPCKGTDCFAWVRVSVVASLGELFLILGKEFTASEIYTVYSTLRIAVLKRRKDHCGKPGVGNNVSGLASKSVRRDMKGWKEMLVEEYCLLRCLDLPHPHDKPAQRMLYNQATQFLHAKLLQDLSPPWVAKQFSQALPGDGVLCRYLKPTFLRWPVGKVLLLFGKDVLDVFTDATHRHGLRLAAIIARPLYICTHAKENGSVCGNLAAMSPLIQMHSTHQTFTCKKCSGDRMQPHQALPVQRVLRLYPQVVVGEKLVAMSHKPMHVMVSAPANDSVWGVGHKAPTAPDTVSPSSPTNMCLFDDRAYLYNNGDSQNIWMHASHIQDVDHDYD